MISRCLLWPSLVFFVCLIVLPDFVVAQAPPPPPLAETDLLRRQIELQEAFQNQLLDAVWATLATMAGIVTLVSAIVVFAQSRLSSERVKAIEDSLRNHIQAETAELDRRQAQRLQDAVAAQEERLTRAASEAITKRLMPIHIKTDKISDLQYSLLELQIGQDIGRGFTEAALNNQRELLALVIERGEPWRIHKILNEIIENFNKPDGRINILDKDLWFDVLKKLGPDYAGDRAALIKLLDERSVS
jgi:hypothetical protein